ncbi:hypothetical protein BU24DRAFT_444855 [Aaosphaeria arxii CBS 175.79]|uniref:Zn(2)-C6 fungal-type domain-containing protein n=1 Tax=Aaosphaeria arxii CBS 175.79 TaxID=1450172 RepID=A0A6A5X933_9PLEO|nr:uncharacterized protein BU24DRAFT_444855 [Aaosphaeria arxii CBS 175.79]KAF2009396.1 hypothetical protein BU24DRAFT_444855 [Aaosphaeria arxii CBS 175.79]
MSEYTESDHIGKKRRLEVLHTNSSLTSSFTRKRSVTACRLCRNRKTKCDNKRPGCSKCQELGATCNYLDDTNPSDPATHILDRLEYLIGLVETNKHVGENAPEPQVHNSVESPLLNRRILPSTNGHQDDGARRLRHSPVEVEREKRLGSSIQSYFGSSEEILGWPIFGARYDQHRIEALIYDPTLILGTLGSLPTSPKVDDDTLREIYVDPRSDSHSGRGMREEDIPALVERFLTNVHTKNPIFEPEYLRTLSKSVVENGIGWEASSCLVLIVCALAAISSPFVFKLAPEVGLNDSEKMDSLSTTLDYSTAEAYYNASRKRMGLLANTLMATECHFLAGVYEMYSLRPMQASISFNRACVAFQTLTWMRSEDYIAHGQVTKARASRLYWSCLKSEHEISVELRCPPSGLTKLNYTNSFPAPPTAASNEDLYELPTLNGSATSPTAASMNTLHHDFEKAWYYYLADIAARRILQRVMDVFYRQSEVSWTQIPLSELLKTATELDRQLDQWESTLPDQVAFKAYQQPEEELSYHLQARMIEIRERIHRPFLYLSVQMDLGDAERASLLPFVQEHTDTCLKLIRQWNIQHRHHGTWLMVRQSFSASLLLLVAYKARLVESLTDEQFQDALGSAIATLQFWEKEAPDLQASRVILQEVVYDAGLSTSVDNSAAYWS